jgi:hypothetical protein
MSDSALGHRIDAVGGFLRAACLEAAPYELASTAGGLSSRFFFGT